MGSNRTDYLEEQIFESRIIPNLGHVMERKSIDKLPEDEKHDLELKYSFGGSYRADETVLTVQTEREDFSGRTELKYFLEPHDEKVEPRNLKSITDNLSREFYFPLIIPHDNENLYEISVAVYNHDWNFRKNLV